MIKNIFLDLDDTILDFTKAERIAVAKTLESFGLSATDEVLDRYHILNLFQWKQLEKGLITRDMVKVRRYENLFSEFSIDADAKAAAAAYENNLAKGHFFIDGAEDFLKESCKAYNLYLVSNGTAVVQDSRIESAGIAKHFKGIYISERLGENKPSKEFFDIVFDDIVSHIDSDFCVSDSIIIGDSLTSDIKGGIVSGLKTVWFNKNGEENDTEIIPDFTVKNFDEVKGLLVSCL